MWVWFVYLRLIKMLFSKNDFISNKIYITFSWAICLRNKNWCLGPTWTVLPHLRLVMASAAQVCFPLLSTLPKHLQVCTTVEAICALLPEFNPWGCPGIATITMFCDVTSCFNLSHRACWLSARKCISGPKSVVNFGYWLHNHINFKKEVIDNFWKWYESICVLNLFKSTHVPMRLRGRRR